MPRLVYKDMLGEEGWLAYVSGETFRYLGRGYKLLVSKAQGEPRVLLKQGTLTVLSSNPEDSQTTRQMVLVI